MSELAQRMVASPQVLVAASCVVLQSGMLAGLQPRRRSPGHANVSLPLHGTSMTITWVFEDGGWVTMTAATISPHAGSQAGAFAFAASSKLFTSIMFMGG